MCSESGFEKLWFMYKIQGDPKEVSINKLCDKQCPLQSLQRLVPKNLEERVVPVVIEGAPEQAVSYEQNDTEKSVSPLM